MRRHLNFMGAVRPCEKESERERERERIHFRPARASLRKRHVF